MRQHQLANSVLLLGGILRVEGHEQVPRSLGEALERVDPVSDAHSRVRGGIAVVARPV